MPRYIEDFESLALGKYIRPWKLRSAGKPAQIWLLEVIKFQRYEEAEKSLFRVHIGMFDKEFDLIT